MLQENEIIRLLLGLGVLVFVIASRSRLRRVPAWSVLSAAFAVLLIGWIITILEGFIWESALNYIEHLCYAGSAVFLLVWCWRVFWQGEERQ